ncbi:MAG: PQQ-dependent sugar dehydrogenase [Chloroflexota bacterium]
MTSLRHHFPGILAFSFISLLLVAVACSGPESPQDLDATATGEVVDDETEPPPEETATDPGPMPTATPADDDDDEDPPSPTATETPAGDQDPPPPTETDTPDEPDPTPTAGDEDENDEGDPTGTPEASQFSPEGVEIALEEVGDGFEQPDFVTHAGDGSGRIFVLEKVGNVKLLDGSTFLDITDRVIAFDAFSYEREQGLLGLAFHPDYEDNGYFYLHYNDLDGDHVISRFSTDDDGLGDPDSEEILLQVDQPEVNFNGGELEFHEGYLYIGLGTGGTAVELQHEAQNLDSLMGKILRIDVDSGDPYGIPPDNPFVDDSDARPEVWAYGLRNPWRFSFDDATGDLYIGGPGQFTREWINYQPAELPGGQNFGWPMFEGTVCWEDWEGDCGDGEGLLLPILEYETYSDGNCVVIGGEVYRGDDYPELQGAYLFADFCSGRIWAGWQDESGEWQQTLMLESDAMISSFGVDEDGEVYVADLQAGSIYRIVEG